MRTLQRYDTRHRTTARRGISLVELLTAFTLFGLIAAIAIPPMARQINHGRVNRAAVLLASDLEMAMSLAGRQRAPVRIAVDPTTRQVLITDRASGSPIVQRTYGDASEFKLHSISATSTVDIMPHGVATTPATYTVAIGDYSRTVTLSRAGLVRVTP